MSGKGPNCTEVCKGEQCGCGEKCECGEGCDCPSCKKCDCKASGEGCQCKARAEGAKCCKC